MPNATASAMARTTGLSGVPFSHAQVHGHQPRRGAPARQSRNRPDPVEPVFTRHRRRARTLGRRGAGRRLPRHGAHPSVRTHARQRQEHRRLRRHRLCPRRPVAPVRSVRKASVVGLCLPLACEGHDLRLPPQPRRDHGQEPAGDPPLRRRRPAAHHGGVSGRGTSCGSWSRPRTTGTSRHWP